MITFERNWFHDWLIKQKEAESEAQKKAESEARAKSRRR